MRRSSALPLILAALLPLAAHAQPAVQSQEGIALENQILQLQQQVQQLQASSGGGGSALGSAGAPPPAQTSTPAAAPDSSVVTNLLTQVGQLQSQVQQLNGQVDTLQNQVTTQNAQMQKEIGDLKFQMGNGTTPPAAAGAAPPAAQTPPAAYIAPPATHESPPPETHAAATRPAHATPKTLLHDAEEAYYKHNYTDAEADARLILSGHGASPEAYKAQYLLAESLAGEGRAQDAAIAYDDAYNRNRTGAEAPESLLGLANALADINQGEAACDTLSSLNSQFPKPPAGLGSRIAAVSHKAHCS